MYFFFSSRRRHTRCSRDWSSDVCSSDLFLPAGSAGIDGFPNAEQTVSQSFSPALNRLLYVHAAATDRAGLGRFAHDQDRKRTRLNSSHGYISYAVFCLKKKKYISISKLLSISCPCTIY